MLPASNFPKVSVIVVNYNGKKYLEKCFSSLAKLDYRKDKLQIIMVDNCSTDDSEVFVKKNFPQVEILRNDVNNFCKANNMGIKASKGEFVALLNNDAYVDPGWLNGLLDIIKKDEKMCCAGSKVLFPDGRIQSAGHIEFPDFYWGDRGLREPDKGQYDTSEEVKGVPLSSALFRKKCLEDVGFLDEDFVMFLEDVDLFLRFRRSGWKVMYAPKSIAYHEFHGTANEKLVNYYVERNRLLLIAKHFPEKLGGALGGRGYFTGAAPDKEGDGIYSLMPEVFLKVLSHHDKGAVQAATRGIFEYLQKLEALQKGLRNVSDRTLGKIAADLKNKVTEIEDNKSALKQKDEIIENQKIDRENLFKSLEENKERLLKKEAMAEKLLAEKDNITLQLRGKESELSKANSLNNHLSSRIECLCSELKLRETEIDSLNASIERLEREIDKIYSSETYRFIARPLWSFLDTVKIKRGKGLILRVVRNLMLFFIVILFFIFVVMPLKVKKLFRI